MFEQYLRMDLFHRGRRVTGEVLRMNLPRLFLLLCAFYLQPAVAKDVCNQDGRAEKSCVRTRVVCNAKGSCSIENACKEKDAKAQQCATPVSRR